MPRSTVYAVPRRHGMNRLVSMDRVSGAVVRYEREWPGELVHLDVKKLGRIPDGGGHRAHGRGPTTLRGRGSGYDHIHSAVDDRSRVAFSQILAYETATSAARFLVEAAGFFAEHGVRIERVLTDNAKAYTESVTFAETAAGLGIRLKRTRRYRPQTNGKVERFHKTLLDEWAYGRLYRSNAERCRAFARWLRLYNHRRPHTSLDGPSGGTFSQPGASGRPSLPPADSQESATEWWKGCRYRPAGQPPRRECEATGSGRQA
jgi:transposase InsO family protein